MTDSDRELGALASVALTTGETALRVPTRREGEREVTASAPVDASVIRIGLLTPYTGGNLGDAAIQVAAMQGLSRCRMPAEFFGITQDPAQTTLKHGMPAMAVHGLTIPGYVVAHAPPTTVSVSSTTQAADRQSPSKQSLSALKGHLKRYGWLRVLHGRFRNAGRALGSIPREAAHLVRSYRMVKRLDLVLVSGGGQIDDEFGGSWAHPYVLFRWALLARLAGTPFAFASVGAHTVARPLSRFFIRTALRLAASRSYRDIKSRELAERIWDRRGDPLVPDLAFGLPVAARSESIQRPDKREVAVSPISYGRSGIWPTPNDAVFERYFAHLSAFCERLIREGDRVAIFTTSSMDRPVAEDLYQALVTTLPPELHSSVSWHDTNTLVELLPMIADARLVVASRLHGVTLSHIVGKPVCAISFDRKVRAHMSHLEQETYLVDIETFTSEQLIACAGTLEGNAQDETARIRHHVGEAARKVADQFSGLMTMTQRHKVQRTSSDRRGLGVRRPRKPRTATSIEE